MSRKPLLLLSGAGHRVFSRFQQQRPQFFRGPRPSRLKEGGGKLKDTQLLQWLEYYESIQQTHIVQPRFLRSHGRLQCTGCPDNLPGSVQGSAFEIGRCQRLCHVCDRVGSDGVCINLCHMSQQQVLTAMCYGYGLCNFCSRAVRAGIGGLIEQQHSIVQKMHAATSAVLQQMVFIKGALGHDVSGFFTFHVQTED